MPCASTPFPAWNRAAPSNVWRVLIGSEAVACHVQVSRCMGDDKVIQEFPDNDQSVAGCSTQFEGGKMSEETQIDLEDYIADHENKSETLDIQFEYKAEEEEKASAKENGKSKQHDGNKKKGKKSSPISVSIDVKEDDVIAVTVTVNDAKK